MRVAVNATTDFRQLKMVMRRKFRDGVRDAIHETGEYLREEAKAIVPVDTGALKASITVSSTKHDDYQERQFAALAMLEKAKREHIKTTKRMQRPHSSPEQFTSGPTEPATRQFLSHKPVQWFTDANVYPQMPYAEDVEIGHHSVPAKPYMIPAAAIAQRDVDMIMAQSLAKVFT